MAVIVLSALEGDSVVVHFGGSVGRIDAYTFANSLIGFADTSRAISSTIDPGQEVEIVVEAYGPGSFRTRVRRIRRDYGGVLSCGAESVFWGIVATVIYDSILRHDPATSITVDANEVVIVHGNDRIVVPRQFHEAAENCQKNPAVQDGLQRTFRPLEQDKRVTDFGLTSKIDDARPTISLPRSDFRFFISPSVLIEASPTERVRSESARLYILKAWLNHAKRKWSFEWNGVPISAPITDTHFLDQLHRREHLLGSGDALDAEVTFKQTLDSELGVYVNQPDSYLVTKVFRPVPRG